MKLSSAPPILKHGGGGGQSKHLVNCGRDWQVKWRHFLKAPKTFNWKFQGFTWLCYVFAVFRETGLLNQSCNIHDSESTHSQVNIYWTTFVVQSFYLSNPGPTIALPGLVSKGSPFLKCVG